MPNVQIPDAAMVPTEENVFVSARAGQSETFLLFASSFVIGTPSSPSLLPILVFLLPFYISYIPCIIPRAKLRGVGTTAGGIDWFQFL